MPKDCPLMQRRLSCEGTSSGSSMELCAGWPPGLLVASSRKELNQISQVTISSSLGHSISLVFLQHPSHCSMWTLTWYYPAGVTTPIAWPFSLTGTGQVTNQLFHTSLHGSRARETRAGPHLLPVIYFTPFASSHVWHSPGSPSSRTTCSFPQANKSILLILSCANPFASG